MAEPLYRRDGDVFVPSKNVRGPWSYDHCHGGPPFGLLTTLMCKERPDMGMTRTTMDIPGPIPLVPCRVELETIRRGKKICHLAATLVGLEGTPYARASAWLMRIDHDVTAQTNPDRNTPASHDSGTPVNLNFWDDEGDFAQSVEMWAVEGTPFGGGAATVWTRLTLPLLEGEATNPYARAAIVSDFPNGVSALKPLEMLACVNTDVTVYFGREPIGDWIALRSQTNSSGLGLGMSDSLLYDVTGFVGTANQSIFFDSPSAGNETRVPERLTNESS
ncbi:MAG: thioesterase family protein [Acidimicrobiia bacterium]|nr:thioesterase family protein [Acidimicrobiia bacterium]